MYWIRILPTCPGGRDVDLPESVKHRNTEGDTIILVPGQTMEVTAEEWKYLNAHHKDFLSKWVLVLAEPR